jgi:hypothetical protein
MNESIEFEDYEPADLVDPEAHAHHHTMCYKDRCRYDYEVVKRCRYGKLTKDGFKCSCTPDDCSRCHGRWATTFLNVKKE